jgi:hypothetical protein
MTLAEALRGIYDCGCEEPATECGCWKYTNKEWRIEGETADDRPGWRVLYDNDVLERDNGWYEQRGDAATLEDLVRLARAMDAADVALQAAFWSEE